MSTPRISTDKIAWIKQQEINQLIQALKNLEDKALTDPKMIPYLVKKENYLMKLSSKAYDKWINGFYD